MLRRSLLPLALLALALAACDRSSTGRSGGGDNDGERGASIPCALGGAKVFKEDCTVERSSSPDGVVLVLHHPDGGFRRLQVATDGRGVVTADGSDAAVVQGAGAGAIEVRVGEDRYRLPATVKGQALPAQ